MFLAFDGIVRESHLRIPEQILFARMHIEKFVAQSFKFYGDILHGMQICVLFDVKKIVAAEVQRALRDLCVEQPLVQACSGTQEK